MVGLLHFEDFSEQLHQQEDDTDSCGDGQQKGEYSAGDGMEEDPGCQRKQTGHE